MGHMPAPQQPIELDPAPESVVEFGPAPERRRRWHTGRAGDLAADRRLVPIAASLAAVAAFASLTSEWQLTTLDRSVFSNEVGETLLPTQMNDLGALGTGYLVGVFGVVATVVLTMFGPAAGRRYARLTGLSVAGTLLGVVLALAISLGEQSRMISRLYTGSFDEDQVQIAYGRGLWCALAAVSLALLALHLAGRHLPGSAAAESATEPADEEATAVWSWRRPPAEADQPEVGEPMELTVAPVKPFTSLADDRDEPTRS